MNFSFLHYETRKLGPQRIMVKSSEVSWPPLLAVSSIIDDDIFYVKERTSEAVERGKMALSNFFGFV